eukprot:12281465-Karenia_brevis.AAC.1
MINEILEKGLENKSLRAIQGKVIYAEGNTFSRLSAPCVHSISSWLKTGPTVAGESSLRWALADLSDKLKYAEDRVVGSRSYVPPVLVFTDGACEKDIVTVGAVLFDGDSRPEHFGMEVPSKVANSWKSKAGQQQ